MFAFLIKIFSALNTNSHPGEIAHAVCIGLLMGFMPKDNTLWYVLFAFFVFFRINKGAFFLTALIMSFIAGFIDPLFDTLGYFVLMLEPLQTIFANLLEVPFVAFTKINNTIVMGSFVGSLLLYIPVYILTLILVKVWRIHIAPALAQNKFLQAFYKLPFVQKIIDLRESLSLE